MKYTCWGAAKQVTGSMHLLELESGQNILIDCGIDYESTEDEDVNARFPFSPKSIDVLILTHAHIDHSGNIPNLVKQGFKGEIICTEPTAALLDKLWRDSVSIQNKKRNKKKAQQRSSLFGYRDIHEAIEQVLTMPFYKVFSLGDDVDVEFSEAGHIIGAASARLTIRDGGKTTVVGFTGDIGNRGSKLIVDSVPMDDLDYLVTETTYGNRMHQDNRTAEDVLLHYATETCVKQRGKLIIPAFSVGRTQAILFTLNKLFQANKLPPIRVYADSPLALASTNVHNRFTHYLNGESKSFLNEHGSLFNFKNLYLVEDDEDAEDMDYYTDSSIVVSSAGMMEGGRIQHHISKHIENPNCTILIAGFCTPGTLGAKLQEHNGQVVIKGQTRLVYAKIEKTDVFSAHPDADGLREYYSESDNDKLKKIFFVHGEAEAMGALKKSLANGLAKKVVIPAKGESFSLS